MWPAHTAAIFADRGILPIGLAVPTALTAQQLNPIEAALSLWGRARRTGFKFYPFANVLPASQAAELMQSRNFYFWALGVASYCGGANRAGIRNLLQRYFYPEKLVVVHRKGAPALKYRKWQRPRISVRRAAWLLYAAAAYPVPWCRITGWSVAGLMEDYIYRRRLPQAAGQVPTLPGPWMYANRVAGTGRGIEPWTLPNRVWGVCLFPPGPGTAPKGAYLPTTRKASVEKFLKGPAFLKTLGPTGHSGKAGRPGHRQLPAPAAK
jgi:hypothetical protein